MGRGKGCERQQKSVIFLGGANLAAAALDKDSDWQSFPRRTDQSRQSDGMNATSNSRLETRSLPPSRSHCLSLSSSLSLALMSHNIAHIRSQSQYSFARGADSTHCASQILICTGSHCKHNRLIQIKVRVKLTLSLVSLRVDWGKKKKKWHRLILIDIF